MKRNRFAKVLSRTDVGANGSHQGGPLIPTTVSGVLPQPSEREIHPSSTRSVSLSVSKDGDPIGKVTASVVSHTRDFSRAQETHLTGALAGVAAKAGDVMVVGRQGRGYTLDIISKRNAKGVKRELGGKRFGYLG